MSRKLMFIVALCFMTMAVTAYGADKLIIQNGSANVFKVTDAGIAMVGDYINDTRANRTLNAIGNAGGMRLWRVHDSYPPFMEFLNSTTTAPDTVTSKWDIYAGVVLPTATYGPRMFAIRDRTSGDINRLIIDVDGNVGLNIGNARPAYPLVVGTGGTNGNGAYLSAGGTWTSTSSRAYKENIKPLSSTDAEATLKGLTPVTFNYKVDKSEHHVGFIAEDVPDLVATSDRKGLSPMDIVAVLTKVVQEQKQTVEALEATVARLEAKLNKLESKDMSAQK